MFNQEIREYARDEVAFYGSPAKAIAHLREAIVRLAADDDEVDQVDFLESVIRCIESGSF